VRMLAALALPPQRPRRLTIAKPGSPTGMQAGRLARRSGVASTVAALARARPPRPLTTAMLGWRTGEWAGQCRRKHGAASKQAKHALLQLPHPLMIAMLGTPIGKWGGRWTRKLGAANISDADVQRDDACAAGPTMVLEWRPRRWAHRFTRRLSTAPCTPMGSAMRCICRVLDS